MSFFGTVLFAGLFTFMRPYIALEGYRRSLMGQVAIGSFVAFGNPDWKPSPVGHTILRAWLDAEWAFLTALPMLIQSLCAPYFDYHNAMSMYADLLEEIIRERATGDWPCDCKTLKGYCQARQ